MLIYGENVCYSNTMVKYLGLDKKPNCLIIRYLVADGEYIVGNLNELYQFRILGEPKEEGSNYVYKVELGAGNVNGVPSERLLAGERFSVEAAFVERELSRGVGDIRFSSPISMRNEWSQIRIKHKVAGSMLNKKLAVGIPIIKQTDGRYTKETKDMWINIMCSQVV